jgi:hypothetical protein
MTSRAVHAVIASLPHLKLVIDEGAIGERRQQGVEVSEVGRVNKRGHGRRQFRDQAIARARRLGGYALIFLGGSVGQELVLPRLRRTLARAVAKDMLSLAKRGHLRRLGVT